MKDKKEKQYLIEDDDLLSEIEAVGPPTSAVAEAEKMHKLTIIQIKASLRNRKTADNLDKSTRKYSLVLIMFAFVQIVLGIFQFLFDAEFSAHPVVGVLYVFSILALLLYMLKNLLGKIEK